MKKDNWDVHEQLITPILVKKKVAPYLKTSLTPIRYCHKVTDPVVNDFMADQIDSMSIVGFHQIFFAKCYKAPVFHSARRPSILQNSAASNYYLKFSMSLFIKARRLTQEVKNVGFD